LGSRLLGKVTMQGIRILVSALLFAIALCLAAGFI
jgi:hypothetical protein